MSFLLACIIFFTMCSVMVFLPGNLLMAWTILSSAFHLSWKFLALLYAMSCFLAIWSKRLMPLSPGFNVFCNCARTSISVRRNVKLYASFFNGFLNIELSPLRRRLLRVFVRVLLPVFAIKFTFCGCAKGFPTRSWC